MSKRHKFIVAMTKQNITVEQARERLGEKFKDMSDKQIEGILNMLYNFAERIVIQTTGGKYGS
jgi:hypothetical protein